MVVLEPTVLLLASEWQFSRVSGAMLGATLVLLIIAASLFGDTLTLLRVATWSTQWLLPCSVLVTAGFVRWLMPRPLLWGKLCRNLGVLFRLWWFVLRWLAPPASRVCLLQAAVQGVSVLQLCWVNSRYDCHRAKRTASTHGRAGF